VKELQSPDKIVQKMTRDGAVEVNKATGGGERISARELEATPADNSAELIGGVEMLLCLAAIVVPSACVELLLALCGFGK